MLPIAKAAKEAMAMVRVRVCPKASHNTGAGASHASGQITPRPVDAKKASPLSAAQRAAIIERNPELVPSPLDHGRVRAAKPDGTCSTINIEL